MTSPAPSPAVAPSPPSGPPAPPQVGSAPGLSLVVPLYDEADNVAPLVADIHRALGEWTEPWELILVDDGSRDGTPKALEEVLSFGEHIQVITLQRNFGQTAAMQAGIDAARGGVIVTLDGDLQNDPADIPRLVAKLCGDELDLLVGWRHPRHDARGRRWVSALANWLIGKVTGIALHDYGCSLKVYRAEAIKGVRLYGEMHRFIPVWVAATTGPHRIGEAVVNHRPRRAGRSKYGFGRTTRVMVDLLAVYFFLKFLARPGHFFGVIGLGFGALGGVILAHLSFVKLFLGEDIGTRPLLLAGVLLVVMGVQFVTTGVLSELMVRVYFAASDSRPYGVRRVARGHGPAPAGAPRL
ncbi:MAG: glycosyltransferase family 2 protein [Candidatus Competibacterales bacterium]